MLLGIGVGFVAGSRAGREPYERLEGKIREVSGRPDVSRATSAAADSAETVADSAVGAVTDKVTKVADHVKAKAE